MKSYKPSGNPLPSTSSNVFDIKVFNNLEIKISKDDLAEVLVVKIEQKLRSDIVTVCNEASEVEVEIKSRTKLINKFINDKFKVKIDKVLEEIKKADMIIKPFSYKRSAQNEDSILCDSKFNIDNWEGFDKKTMKIVLKKILYNVDLNYGFFYNLSLKPIEITVSKEVREYAEFRNTKYKVLNNLYTKLHNLNTELADIGFKRRVLRARLIEDSLASSTSGRNVLKLLNSPTK